MLVLLIELGLSMAARPGPQGNFTLIAQANSHLQNHWLTLYKLKVDIINSSVLMKVVEEYINAN
jgi:hypothetical protein